MCVGGGIRTKGEEDGSGGLWGSWVEEEEDEEEEKDKKRRGGQKN